ncbi:MAG TPA: zinc-binding dehydrogenase [Acidimicrobiales bacterium]|nr:zinc-binding dehydrogenase [Acidimicrobiales bacterium]
MRAAALKAGQIYVNDDAPEPKPDTGQVLVEVCACGICGSDLHFAKHGASMMALGSEMKGMGMMGEIANPTVDLSKDVWMGHEFSAKVLEVGPDTQTFAPDTIVTSIPILLGGPTGLSPIVYSNSTMGGYAERMLLSAPMLVEVPNGLDPKLAALTEPMAVGLHGVNRSGIAKGQGALVLGCGPVGLAIVAALQVKGIEPIVAADFSPKRREMALTMGAHEAVDPREETSFEAWNRVGCGKSLCVYEAIGVPGIINDILKWAPPRTQVTVVGVCMEPDTITPFFGIGKEIDVSFCLGYDPMEFAGSLRSIAEGEIDVRPMITSEVNLDGVAGAFEALGDPERDCKILVVPNSA